MKYIWNEIKRQFSSFRLSLRFDPLSLLRAAIRVFALILLASLQTTLLSRFKLFGVTPDIMLPAVLAIAISDGKVKGAAYGITAGVIIDSIGSVGLSLSPLLYSVCGFAAAYFIEIRFSDNAAVHAVYIFTATVLRSVITLFLCALNIAGFIFTDIFTAIIIPEFFATLLISPLPFIFVRLLLKIARKKSPN